MPRGGARKNAGRRSGGRNADTAQRHKLARIVFGFLLGPLVNVREEQRPQKDDRAAFLRAIGEATDELELRAIAPHRMLNLAPPTRPALPGSGVGRSSGTRRPSKPKTEARIERARAAFLSPERAA